MKYMEETFAKFKKIFSEETEQESFTKDEVIEMIKELFEGLDEGIEKFGIVRLR